jgi:hypothetical protein
MEILSLLFFARNRIDIDIRIVPNIIANGNPGILGR